MKDGYNVLSVFDGMSCGRVALEELDIPIKNYFASEIDPYAMTVAANNYLDTIHIGDVTKVSGYLLPKIDLLIGGSPCQGFSFAGKQLNFEDPRSKLFFEFVRLKEECKPKFFFLENVKMKKEFRDVISSYLGVEPVFVDSSNFSAHNRPRWYWTNIPGAREFLRVSSGKVIKDIICTDIIPELYLNAAQIERGIAKSKPQKFASGSSCGAVTFPTPTDRKVKSLTATSIKGSREVTHIKDKNGIRVLSRNEKELAQGLPKNYTAGVSYSKASSMIGNGWTVAAVKEFFKHLPPADELDLY
jgi:site-specific DNA-cytosine methylase